MSIIADTQAEINTQVEAQIEQLKAAAQENIKAVATTKLDEKKASVATQVEALNSLQAEIAADEAELNAAYPAPVVEEEPTGSTIQG